jgi:uncharacterized protein DUF2637
VTGDRVIRFATAAVVCAVAAFAAVVSYSHIYGLGRAYGQDGTAARLLPLSVDGLILAASLVLLHEARNGRDVPRLARFMLWLGIAATIGANIAYGARYGLLGALISAWPAVAFIGSVEIAMQQVRRARVPRAVTSGPAVPEVPGDVGQAVRAAYAASVAAGQPLSQRAMAERFGLSRRKVSQLITTIAVDSNGHRVPAIGGAELGGQLAEAGRQHRRVLGTELPGHPNLAQLTMGVLQRHAGLARATQPMQRHHPWPLILAARQPGIQCRQQFLPARQERRPRCQPQHRARRPATGGPAGGRPVQLGQLGLHSGAQPLDQTLPVAELRRADLAGDLLPERRHQRQLLRIGQVGKAHVRDAGAQQRDSRDTRLAGPPELQVGDRQALRIVRCGPEPVPVPQDQHIQVAGVHIVQATVAHRVAIGLVTMDRLVPCRDKPVHDDPPFPLQVGDRGRHIDLGHHHPPRALLTPALQGPVPRPLARPVT